MSPPPTAADRRARLAKHRSETKDDEKPTDTSPSKQQSPSEPTQPAPAASQPPSPPPVSPPSSPGIRQVPPPPPPPSPPAPAPLAGKAAAKGVKRGQAGIAEPRAIRSPGKDVRSAAPPPEPTPGAPHGEPRPTRSATPGQGGPQKGVNEAEGLRAISPTRAQDVIQEQMARKVVRATTLKLPHFPAPASDRPQAMQDEQQRRERIAQKEAERRAKVLEGLTPEEIKKYEQEWQAEDELSYRPDPDDRELEVFAIHEPYAYVQIIRNDRTHATLYHVIEPKLSRDEKLLLDFIEKTLVDVLDLQPSELDKTDLPDYIRGKFDQVIYDYSIRLGDEESTEEASRARLLYYVMRDFIGEGPIDVFIRDPMIEDISCDGPHQPIFIYHRKYESITTTVRFRGHEELDSFVIRLAQRAGKHVSIAEPILDATLRDGSRLQATLAKEVSTFGSTFTIRKFREVPFSPVDLVRFGTMSSTMLAYLWMVIQYHQSAIYAGGTASGKTTAINAIMLFIPPQLKVITIEDTREINIPQPNWIAGLTRGGFGPRDAHGRQAGEIDMFQLLKNALRQRPEYIIVGEVRGAEAYNLFQAMATGHAAYGTMHADSVDAVIHRLESDPINIPRALLEALDVVAVQIQTRVGGKRVRRTKQITEIVGLDPNTREILTNEVFTWDPASDKFNFSGISYSLERIAAETGLSSQEVLQEMEDRVRVINWMVDQDIRLYKTVAEIITNYFYDKAAVLAKVDGGLPWA
jgi:archaeal flagellar protein FlaI